MYKQLKNDITGAFRDMALRIEDGATIPFDPANTDYQQFKQAINDGAELQDADGDVMDAKAAQAFLATLP